VDAAFNKAIEITLSHEGGFVDDPVDPGGATNFGVSLRWLRSVGELEGAGSALALYDLDQDGDLDADDVAQLTREMAKDLYRTRFWEPHEYASMPASIGAKTFDLAVNMGPRQAHRLVQRACRAADREIADDGLLGPQTRAAIRQADELALQAALRSEAAGFYRGLAIKRPAFNRFLNGWLRRAYS
jgi:lysozyme family protein